MVGGFEVSKGEGRARVTLSAYHMGGDLVVLLYNENAHLGAVAVGEYDLSNQRTSTSVITRLGHKDDIVAQKAAYKINKSTKRPVCVIAGIHVDNITKEEIEQIVNNARSLVETFVQERTSQIVKSSKSNRKV